MVARPTPARNPLVLLTSDRSPAAARRTACFLDDLFVAPEHRGTGAVDALLAGLRTRSRERGWSQVRWITRASNEPGPVGL